MPNLFRLFFRKDGDAIPLPVNPAKLPVEENGDNQTYNVLGIGPVTVPRIPKPREIKISSYFPGRIDQMVLDRSKWHPPEFYIEFFRSAMNDKLPIMYAAVRYFEDGTPFMTNEPSFQVLVSSFHTEERGGETGDFYYDLTLTEYRDYSPQTVTLQQSAGAVQSGQGPAPATAEVTREIPAGQLYVGGAARANGPWYYDSYGSEPHGEGSGRRVVVGRIITTDPTRPRPVLVKSEEGAVLGWMAADNLQAVSA